MDSICRLCCSTHYVNNYLFDEENALNLKMELFLPIKVTKGDKLPQKVCDRCSFILNDIYQFCNIAIETQVRLRSMLLHVGINLSDSIDLSIPKREEQLPKISSLTRTEQGTQTDDISCKEIGSEQVKEEPKSPLPTSPFPIKRESSVESDHYDPSSVFSDSSEDMSLIALKRKKRGRKQKINLDHKVDEKDCQEGDRGKSNNSTPMTRRRKKVNNHNVTVHEKLPNDIAVDLIRKSKDSLKNKIKSESVLNKCDNDTSQSSVVVKKEPTVEDTYQCCICFAKCYSRSDILQHYRQHAVSEGGSVREMPPPPPPTEQARCPRCGKIVDGGGGAWSDHWRRHWERDARPYRCALCEKTFRDPHQILKHGMTHKAGESEQEHALKKRFICDFCPERFVYMRYLLSHRSVSHPEAAGRPLSLRCAVCGRGFAHLNSLRRHLRAHSGELNFLCSVCGKALSSREHLKFHLRIHTGYKPNVCKTCGKGFVKKCNLTLHERVHSGEKPHVCSHCGKAFSQRSTLVIHERYHSGARPYVCALCGRGFVAKGLLSMHLKTTCI